MTWIAIITDVRRHLFIVAFAVSMLLSIATVILWVDSLSGARELVYSRATQINGRYTRTHFIALSGPGFVVFQVEHLVPVDDASAVWMQNLDRKQKLGWSFGGVDSWPFSFAILAEGFRRIGVYSGSDTNSRFAPRFARRFTSVEVPDWLILLIVSLPFQVGLIRFWRRRRGPSRGQCPGCGYDLTRNASGTCPECGRPVQHNPAAIP